MTGRRERSQSVDRAIEILRVLAVHGPQRLADLEPTVAAPRRVLQRLLVSLEAGGLVQRDAATRRYDLGIGAAVLGRLATERVDLARVAPPHLTRLLHVTGQTALLLVRQGGLAVSAHLEAPADGPAMVFPVGRSIPLWRGAARAILAFLPGDEQAVLGSAADVDDLADRLAEVRRCGYAVGHAEVLPGALAVGAPVFDPFGECIAAVVALGHDAHLDVDRCAPAVIAAAGELTASLGGHPRRPASNSDASV
ncbi:MAG: IclR family transcriptional regulator [Acidimicrobiales bacterium]